MSGMCRRLGMSAAAPSCSCPPTACALEMPSPSSWPDTPAQEHADTVREALNFGYGGDPNYRPFYEDGITALDALLKEVERLTAERDEARQNLGLSDDMHGEVRNILKPLLANGHNAFIDDDAREVVSRAKAAERERDEARRELAEECERNPSRVVCPRCQANLPCESCRQYSIARYDWERRAEAAEALAERRGEALRQIKPLVTGDLPPLTPLPMTMRCVRIADIIDAALARFAALQPENQEEER